MKIQSGNRVADELLEELNKIDRPGSFCVSGSTPPVLPGLEVNDMGPIALPLSAAQAKKLKKYCHQAPYGKGEETVVDTKVRRVWRMEPDRFVLTNPDWQLFVDQTVGTVQSQLGLQNQQLQAHLYDLLLYEPGSFFLPHRDGEKLDRMVATVVIVLPSSFEGGELVVRHEGQEQTIDFGSAGDTRFRTHFAAFYADCEHEIRPLREGYRLCLVYNLTLAKSKKTISAPRSKEHIERIGRIFSRWVDRNEGRKLVVTLDHQYTQDGLSWDALKGIDRAQAQILREAAREAGCHAYLALLTFWESGSAECSDSGYRSNRYGYRNRYYEENDDDSASDYVMGEVFDSSLTAEEWTDEDGNRVPIGGMTVDTSELIDPEALTAVIPDEDFEGYTGNAGMTLERWYRHAAILIWPDKRHFDVLCDCGSRFVIPALAKMVADWRGSSKENAVALRERCLAFAAAIIGRWQPIQYASMFHTKEQERDDLLGLLVELDEPAMIRAFLVDILAKDASASPGKSLPTVCARHGWATFAEELGAVFKSTNQHTLERNVELLTQFCLAKGRKPEARIELCRLLAQDIVAALQAIDQKAAANDWQAKQLDRSKTLARLAQSLIATEQEDLLSRLLAHVLDASDRYPLTETHVAALASLRPWLEKNVKRHCVVLLQWIATCCGQLASRTAAAPQEPADFCRSVDISCKCADCKELKLFLDNPHEKVHRFPVRKERRQHLHMTIENHGCDVEHVTDRGGNPQILVCTKNTASFQRRLNKYHQDQEHLAMLRSLQEKLP